MKILLTLKLLDRNLFTHIYPISRLEEVERIDIVRDTSGPEIEKVTYHTPPRWLIGVPPVCFIAKFFLLVKIALMERPSLILGYLYFPHGLLAYVAAKVTRTKVGVSLIAGVLEVYGIGPKSDRLTYTRPLPRLTLLNKLNYVVFTTMSLLIVGGSYSRDQLVRMGLDPGRIFILYKPQGTEFGKTDDEKEYDAVYVGRLAEVKHVETILRAIALVRREMPGVSLAIVGDGPDRQSLETLAQDLDLCANVHFMGWQDNPSYWLNKARISVLASAREGFPQSVVQSLCCGVPVVVSACGDITDLVKDSYNGFVVQDHEDVDGFSRAISYLLMNPDILQEFSSNALEIVDTHLGIDRAANTWRSIIESV